MLGGVGGCRLRARIAKTTSPLAIPASKASAQACATAATPSSGTRPRIFTNCRSPSAWCWGRAHNRQRRRQILVFEWRAIPERVLFAHQHVQIMPRIVDDLAEPKAVRMIGDDLSRLGVDAVLDAAVRDQARRRRAHRLLDQAGWRAKGGPAQPRLAPWRPAFPCAGMRAGRIGGNA